MIGDIVVVLMAGLVMVVADASRQSNGESYPQKTHCNDIKT